MLEAQYQHRIVDTLAPLITKSKLSALLAKCALSYSRLENLVIVSVANIIFNVGSRGVHPSKLNETRICA